MVTRNGESLPEMTKTAAMPGPERPRRLWLAACTADATVMEALYGSGSARSGWLERHHGHTEAATYSIATLSEDVLGIVSDRHGHDPAVREALRRYGAHLGRALQALHDAWVDGHGPELRKRAEPLYLLRQRYLGAHVREAQHRGVDLSRAVERVGRGEVSIEASAEILGLLEQSGAFESVLARAEAEARTAAAALGGLPDSLDDSGLLLLARNVGRAIAHARAEPTVMPARRSGPTACRRRGLRS